MKHLVVSGFVALLSCLIVAISLFRIKEAA